jgi:hypothetical protein
MSVKALARFLPTNNSWEVFIEKIAEVLAGLLTDQETELIVDAFKKFTDKVKELSR